MSRTRLRLRVDPIRCDGARYCAEMLPELVQLDPWGYPVLAGEAIEDPALLRLARRAVAACPRVALFLEDAEEGSRRRR